jgi:hypothetical protein
VAREPHYALLTGSAACGMEQSTEYELDGQGFGVRVPVGQEYLLLHVVQTGSGAYPASYPMDTGALSLGVKRPGREVDQSSPTSAEVNKTVYTSTPPYVFMA